MFLFLGFVVAAVVIALVFLFFFFFIPLCLQRGEKAWLHGLSETPSASNLDGFFRFLG